MFYKNFFLVGVLLFLSVQIFAQNRPIGVNLPEFSYFSSSVMLKNVKKHSSAWFIEDEDQSQWNFESVTMPTLANGYPSQVPFNVNGVNYRPHCIILSGQAAPHTYPAGEFTIIITGTGEVNFEWDGNATFTGPGTFTLPVTPSDAGLHLRILSSDINDPITNIEVIYPGEIDTYPNDIFSSHFVRSMEPFESIRFMKATSTEENPIINWSDRTLIDDHTYFSIIEGDIQPGTPWELVIRFCNEHDKDPWICIPYQANDDYVTNLATLFRDNLNPDLQLYVEYSNETWNWFYINTFAYLGQQGMDLGLASDEFTANLRYNTYRSLQIFEIFEQVYGSESSSRIQKVLANSAWDYPIQTTYNALFDSQINPNNILPDAFATAPYVGVGEEFQDSPHFCDSTAEGLLSRMYSYLDSMEVQPYFDYADSLGIPVLAYEGGQHLAATGFQAAQPCVATLIRETNLLPQMQSWYCEYYDRWFDSFGGGLHMAFVIAEQYGDFGAFGILESQFQDYTLSPKWMAHENCVFPVTVLTADEDIEELSFQIFPNPNVGQLTIQGESSAYHIEVLNIHGIAVRSFDKTGEQIEVDISSLNPGLYFVKIKNNRTNQVYFHKVIKQ